MPRMSKEWYIKNGKPLPAYITEGVKNYNWYVQRGMKPPAGLKEPKVIKDTVGNLTVLKTELNTTTAIPVEPAKVETDAEIEARILTRIEAFDGLVDDVIEGDITSLIVSGPPGMGKSFPVEKKLMQVDKARIVKGHSSAKALYELLYQYKEPGNIVVFDDADSVFTDERALNILKTALDTTEVRVLSWLTSGPFGSSNEDAEVPSSYQFEGSIIFITNLDFDGLIQKGNKIAPHLQAIISRSHYVDLMMKSRRDMLIRVKQVVRDTPMLSGWLKANEVNDVMDFIESNLDSLREISLRTALKVGTLRKSGKANWKDIATVTVVKS